MREEVPVSRWCGYHAGIGQRHRSGAVEVLRGRHGLARGTFVEATFGLMTPDKTVETAAHPVVRVAAAHSDIRLLVVGPVADRSGLEWRLADLGALGRTIVTRRVLFEELSAYMELADVVVDLR